MTNKEAWNSTLGTVNSAISILDLLPKFDTDVNVKLNINPISMLVQLLIQLKGYDATVEMIAKWLGKIPETIEPVIKAAILAQLAQMYSCSVNPIITEDVIKNGILFDLKNIDLANIFRFCPLQNEKKNNYGRYYYFGCEDMNYPEDLMYSTDMNAFLWYAVNRSYQDRCVWYGSERQSDPNNHTSDPVTPSTKQNKNSGIVTIEYSTTTAGLRNADGGDYFPQVPHNNCLHVFLGNTKPIDSAVSAGNKQIRDDIASLESDMNQFTEVLNTCNKYKRQISAIQADLQNQNLNQEELSGMRNVCMLDQSILNAVIYCIENNKTMSSELAQYNFVNNNDGTAKEYYLNSLEGTKLVIPNYVFNTTVIAGKNQHNTLMSQYTPNTSGAYRTSQQDYYYLRFLQEFNTRYLFSTKMLDSKVIVAELLDALSGALTLSLDLSFEERLIQNEIAAMVDDVINTDTAVVSDCFFAFDNDEYNNLVERTEAQRLGAYVSPDGIVGSNINPEDILARLDSLSPDATLDEQIDVINQALVEASQAMHTGEYQTTEVDANLQFDFIQNIINRLIYVIVRNLLSPKIYLLLAINMKLMGEEPTTNIASLLLQMKNLLVTVMREIRDQIIKGLYDMLMELIGMLAASLGAKLMAEQFQYYTALLAKCIDCFNRLGVGSNSLGWNMAQVGYADIYSDGNNNQPNPEC